MVLINQGGKRETEKLIFLLILENTTVLCKIFLQPFLKIEFQVVCRKFFLSRSKLNTWYKPRDTKLPQCSIYFNFNICHVQIRILSFRIFNLFLEKWKSVIITFIFVIKNAAELLKLSLLSYMTIYQMTIIKQYMTSMTSYDLSLFLIFFYKKRKN